MAAVGALAAIAAWVWYSWLPSYRPALKSDERYGVDVSNHQGEIDWDQVAQDNINFAYIKATEGGDYVDTSFHRNWDKAAAAGLDRGAYHFFTLCRPGADQATNFLRTVPADPKALPPAIDLELAGNCSQRPDRPRLLRELTAFVDTVESATDQQVVLYIGGDFERLYSIHEELNRPVWHRQILRRPNSDDWWIWQFHYRASVEGIDGDVDLNIMEQSRSRPGPRGR